MRLPAILPPSFRDMFQSNQLSVSGVHLPHWRVPLLGLAPSISRYQAGALLAGSNGENGVDRDMGGGSSREQLLVTVWSSPLVSQKKIVNLLRLLLVWHRSWLSNPECLLVRSENPLGCVEPPSFARCAAS